jgi:hypothetical protein
MTEVSVSAVQRHTIHCSYPLRAMQNYLGLINQVKVVMISLTIKIEEIHNDRR